MGALCAAADIGSEGGAALRALETPSTVLSGGKTAAPRSASIATMSSSTVPNRASGSFSSSFMTSARTSSSMVSGKGGGVSVSCFVRSPITSAAWNAGRPASIS